MTWIYRDDVLMTYKKTKRIKDNISENVKKSDCLKEKMLDREDMDKRILMLST